MRKLWTWVALFSVFSALAVVAAELPHGFRLEPVLSGLTNPTSLAGTPDGRILITERTTGKLRVVKYGELQAGALCTVAVNSTGEGGLLGVVIHPDFATNGWAYLYYTDLASGKNKVKRFTLGASSCTAGPDILPDLGVGATFTRNGCGMAFGPSGKLYVATGDVEDPANGQTTGVLQGKVLRVNADGSNVETYAIGVRDGRGLTINPAGQVYLVDGGDDVSSAYDELNLVNENGNLGWDDDTGPGGIHDEPLSSWLPTLGLHGTVAYPGGLFPDLDSDGLDSDHDKWGPDRFPGQYKIDDNGAGVCVGSVANGNPCTADANCTPLRSGESKHYCEKKDDAAEYCPGGTPIFDDACGAAGTAGIDEADEAFSMNIFAAADDAIIRTVLEPPGLDALRQSEKFLDSAYLADCPTGWTAVMAGSDGQLYAVATNGGGANGKLYRVIHDETAGPREVSATGSYFPLRVDKTAFTNSLNIFWEDLRQDSMQPQNVSATIFPPKREYTIWRGTLGNYYSHTAATVTEGTEVNSALRKQAVSIDATKSYYFLVSGRSDNLEGTLGYGEPGERPGYAVTDLCLNQPLYGGPPWIIMRCGKNFTLVDAHGQTRNLYEFRGKPILLDFSAIWCAPCHDEANQLEDLFLEFEDRGVEFITVLMDEESNTISWDMRPLSPECRLWEDRPGVFPDHTFECWADPIDCTPNGGPTGTCNTGLPFVWQAWTKYDAHNALPTNVVLDQGLRVVYSGAGYDEVTIRAKLNVLLGNTDQCLH